MTRTEIARQRYCRAGLRYASDLTDAEWALIASFMPAPASRGRPRSVSLRVIVEAILYMLSTGCQWRQLPREFAPFTTVQAYFYRFSRDGTLMRFDVPPVFWSVLSWNFPIMIPLMGEGEFHEEVEVFGGADRLHPAPGG